MSSYVVSHQTINRALMAAFNALYHTNSKYSAADVLGTTPENKVAEIERFLSKLGNKMLDLNDRATSYRYDNTPETVVDLYRFKLDPNVNKYQSLKSLSCWRYQCFESDDFTSEPIFTTMTKFKDWLAYRLIDAMPEYDEAEWG